MIRRTGLEYRVTEGFSGDKTGGIHPIVMLVAEGTRDFKFDINSETSERELYPSEEYHAGFRTGRLPLKSIRSCGSILRLFRPPERLLSLERVLWTEVTANGHSLHPKRA